MEVMKTRKIRLYPNQKQEQELLKVVGSCRYIWNYFLDKRVEHYIENKKTIPYLELSRELTKLRSSVDWLKEINATALQQKLRVLDKSYNRFFRKLSKFPKFKSKKDSRESFVARYYRIEDNKLQIYKGLKIKFRGTAPEKPQGMMRIVRELDKWYACIPFKEKIKKPRKYKAPIGIDVGLTQLAITSKGKKYDNFRPRKKSQAQIKALSQSLARKQKGSNRRSLAKLELGRLHQKISNQRLNHLHKVSSSIASENQALIAVEDLSVANMMKNHKLAGSFADTGVRTFLTMLEYKQGWRGGKFVKIGRFFPSSKTCCKCHLILKELPLSVREWKCPKCKTIHDRDINAAKNILQQGLAYSSHRG